MYGSPLKYSDPTGQFAFLYPVAVAVCEGGGCAALANAAISSLGALAIANLPDIAILAAPGNVADTRIVGAYNEYASNERLNCRDPLDRCTWLELNAHLFPKDAVKKTQKAWGCRRSRAGR